MVLAPVLLLVHFLCQDKCLHVSVLPTAQPFGYPLMKYPLSPETSLALLQPLGIRVAGGLLRWAQCCC